MANDNFFWAGVIEGFYGKPWTLSERVELFEWMGAWGLNTYLYAPKDDLHHRILWRSQYPADQLSALSHLIQVCDARGLHFAYGLGPGLDIRYSDTADLDVLKDRYGQVLKAGCRYFALLFDDIPAHLSSVDVVRFSSFASAQAFIANELFRWLSASVPDARLLFCPTPYCGRMAFRDLGGPGYLEVLGRELLPPIDVFWTGPEIVSGVIKDEDARQLAETLRRRPVLWDNLHANDYDASRFYCGPYSGRDRTLLAQLNGVFTNPNCEFPLNYVPIRTLAEFLRGKGDWNPRASFCKALDGWLERFDTVLGRPGIQEVMNFVDCFYLPQEEGAGARDLLHRVRDLLRTPPAEWDLDASEVLLRVSRLKEFCANLPALRDRSLFHALSRRGWDLREELDLLEQAIRQNLDHSREFRPARSDFHLPGTYRGGVIQQLRQLLTQRPDGSFAPSHNAFMPIPAAQ